MLAEMGEKGNGTTHESVIPTILGRPQETCVYWVYPITWVEIGSWCPFRLFFLLKFEKGTNMKEKTEDLLRKAWVLHVSTCFNVSQNKGNPSMIHL